MSNRPPLLPDPIAQFTEWYEEAKRCKAIEQANAACLSTLGLDGFPDGRMVLLKQHDERGFVFYTNLYSVKGKSLAEHPKAALIFHWDPLKRQVRIQGTTAVVSTQEADAYWGTRPRISQIGAWASFQSMPLDRNRTFIKRLAEQALRFGTSSIPRPPHWSGIRIIPTKMEFWRARRGRLHERVLYTRRPLAARPEDQWQIQRLYP